MEDIWRRSPAGHELRGSGRHVADALTAVSLTKGFLTSEFEYMNNAHLLKHRIHPHNKQNTFGGKTTLLVLF